MQIDDCRDVVADVPARSQLLVSRLQLLDGERWYAVHAQPHRESGAEMQLRLQGYRSFLPQTIKTIRHGGQFRTARAPLFPRYFFVILNLKRDRWRSVNGTSGVSSLIMAHDRPAPVPNGVVEALLEMATGPGFVHADQDIAVGQNVRVLAGPFTDIIGSLERTDDKGRVRVLLDIMGGKVPTVLQRRHVKAV
ncbi:transcription termination/antitermination protein NusG [Microvirga massiliensis]|uniref:transcription termination/antitermination protein NusG n=1 Tax=Microvirga massiliensis TaxID=1033741 RepID=UPI0009E38A3D|nr:transcription termination/antitermination NusG family protein [Microvirga massiliensis]